MGPRPGGAPDRKPAGGGPAPRHRAATRCGALGTDPRRDTDVLDFDTDDDDEPRTIVIRGFGPRWSAKPVLGGDFEGTP